MALVLATTFSCSSPPPVQDRAQISPGLGDSLLTLFDSLAAIHRGHPDTALLRRLHPAQDTILFIEGERVERLTGDSLYRRVVALHVPVKSMAQTFSNRTIQLLDSRNAVLAATERVHWFDASGAHDYSGLLLLVASRRDARWVIRAYRGT